jgi:hypothetical protein
MTKDLAKALGQNATDHRPLEVQPTLLGLGGASEREAKRSEDAVQPVRGILWGRVAQRVRV